MKLLSGNSNRTLSAAIAAHLDMPLTKAQVKRFADNEVFAMIEENVRGEDVFILQSTSYPANDNLMELLILTDALVRASAKLAIVDKRRPKAGESEVMNIIGDVEGRRCILFDDIVDSGGTLVNAAKALIDKGATEVSAYISHGVLSGPAVQRITDGPLKELVITDSIEQPDEVLNCSKIRRVSVAPLIGEAIRRIANEESVSKLFD
ncbi:MAG: ribose-phosphate diphosphokinase [Brevundimonas sp.]|nr:MAG: ribose-phosphate diphosphokinase [Brevundimonas sp.]